MTSIAENLSGYETQSVRLARFICTLSERFVGFGNWSFEDTIAPSRVNYPALLGLTGSVRAGLARRIGGWDSPTRSRLVAQGQTPAAI